MMCALSMAMTVLALATSIVFLPSLNTRAELPGITLIGKGLVDGFLLEGSTTFDEETNIIQNTKGQLVSKNNRYFPLLCRARFVQFGN